MGIRDLITRRRELSLDELQGTDSPSPEPGDTWLVTTCLRLRKVPIKDYTIGELRLMIGQRDGLMFLMPIALEHLGAAPLVEGNYYPGDLLCAVLRAGQEFWNRHIEYRADIEKIIAGLDDMPKAVKEALADFRAAKA